jgi:amino acid permease
VYLKKLWCSCSDTIFGGSDFFSWSWSVCFRSIFLFFFLWSRSVLLRICYESFLFCFIWCCFSVWIWYLYRVFLHESCLDLADSGKKLDKIIKLQWDGLDYMIQCIDLHFFLWILSETWVNLERILRESWRYECILLLYGN